MTQALLPALVGISRYVLRSMADLNGLVLNLLSEEHFEEGAFLGQRLGIFVLDQQELELQGISAEPLGQLADNGQQQPQHHNDPLNRKVDILVTGAHEVRVEAEQKQPAAAEKLVLVPRVIIQLVAKELDVEQVRPQVRVALHERKLGVQQAFNAPFGRK